MLKIHPIPAFTDNYIWAIYDQHHCVVVDPGDAAQVIAFLHENALSLAGILITHHHHDHTGGISQLLSAFPDIDVFGPKNHRIDGIKTRVSEGDVVSLFNQQLLLNVLDVPGHTLDHIAYFNDKWVFCGDTLFSAGCGRMFEGNPSMFWGSLQKLTLLDDNTKVFCTHEYTLANLAFALHIDGENAALRDYEKWAVATREKMLPTLPTDIKTQKRINPFLRCDDEAFVAKLKRVIAITENTAEAVFAACRSAKDQF